MCLEEVAEALEVLNKVQDNKKHHITPDPLYVDRLLQDLDDCHMEWAKKPIKMLEDLKSDWFR
jgi:hypothetical protein